jgi:hypothetical protein
MKSGLVHAPLLGDVGTVLEPLVGRLVGVAVALEPAGKLLGAFSDRCHHDLPTGTRVPILGAYARYLCLKLMAITLRRFGWRSAKPPLPRLLGPSRPPPLAARGSFILFQAGDFVPILHFRPGRLGVHDLRFKRYRHRWPFENELR